MIYTVLKLVVTIVVMIVSLVVLALRWVLTFTGDTAAQAKAATPGVVANLKAHASEVAAKSGPVMAKVDSDIRKITKIERKKEAA